MIDIREELKKKKWPVRSFSQEDVYGQEVNEGRANYEFESYVTEGRLSARPLCPPGRSKLIPPGESAITSLVKDPLGRIFGGTSGRYCHLFLYNPKPEGNFVIDIGKVGDENSINHSLVSLNDGRIFGATCNANEDVKTNYDGGYIFSYVPRGDFSCEFGYRVSKIELLTIPIKGEGIIYLVLDEGRNVLYGLSQSRGTIFIYHLETKKVIEKAVLDPSGQGKFSKILLIDPNGRLYGERQGNMFIFNPEENEVRNIGIKLPALKGRIIYNRLDSAVLDYENGYIYGGCSADGLMFRANLQTKEVIVLGKPTAQARVRAMAATLDGRIYGITGDKGGIAHLFCYDPAIHELKDLGIPLITYPKYWHGIEFDSAVTGQWGEIYFGESDRISNLFIYYPPIKKKYIEGKNHN